MIEFAHAVICVSHCNQCSVWGCYQINQAAVSFAQVFFEDDHCKNRGAGRNISRAFCHAVCCDHAGSCVSFWWSHFCSGFQFSAWIKEFCSLSRHCACIFTGEKNFRKNFFKFPRKFFVSDKIVEFGNEIFIVVLGGCVNREHTRSVADSENFVSSELPVDESSERSEERHIFYMLFIVQNCLIKM